MHTQPRSRKRKETQKPKDGGGQFVVYITVNDEVVQTFYENAKSPEAVVQRYREEKKLTEIQKLVGDGTRFYIEIEKA